MAKRKTYTKYPKILTVTCVTCGDTTEVLLKCVTDYRRRFYCSEKCEREYLTMARRQASSSRHGKGRPSYTPLLSLVLGERPAACSSPKNGKATAKSAKALREEAIRKRDLEYWSALRRAKGIEAGVDCAV